LAGELCAARAPGTECGLTGSEALFYPSAMARENVLRLFETRGFCWRGCTLAARWRD